MSPLTMPRETLLTAPDLKAKIERLALEIFEVVDRDRPLVVVGVHSRGVPIARRIASLLSDRGVQVVDGTLDISLYRDDLGSIERAPKLIGSDIPFDLDGAHVVLIDDVLFTGRTVKAAIDALTDYGRPARIELAVLIDRGNRELPIQADYLGEFVETDAEDQIQVLLEEADGEDGVFHITGEL